MDPKEQLKKAQELIDAYKALNIPEDSNDELYVVRLFVEAEFPRFTIKQREL